MHDARYLATQFEDSARKKIPGAVAVDSRLGYFHRVYYVRAGRDDRNPRASSYSHRLDPHLRKKPHFRPQKQRPAIQDARAAFNVGTSSLDIQARIGFDGHTNPRLALRPVYGPSLNNSVGAARDLLTSPDAHGSSRLKTVYSTRGLGK